MNQDQESIKKGSTDTLNSQTVLLKSSVAAGTLPGLLGCQNKSGAKMIGIQIGPVSFVDEGIENVLDILQDRGAVNTIFLSTFSYDRGISGRQIPGRPFPDHGVQKSDEKYIWGIHILKKNMR